MSESAYIGTTDFTRQQVFTQFVEGQGWLQVVPYTGSKSKLNAFLAEIFIIGGQFGGINAIRVYEQGTIALVEVSFAQSPYNTQQPDPISTTWTMVPNMLELDIMSHAKVQNGFPGVPGLSTYTTQALLDFKRKLQDLLSGNATSEPTPGSLLEFVYNRKAREISTITVPQYVLRKTQTVFSKSQITASHTNVGKVFNKDKLRASEPTLPSAILIDPIKLDAVMQGQTELSWLKFAPEVDQTTGGRYQIIQEYWSLAYYDPVLYEQAI